MVTTFDNVAPKWRTAPAPAAADPGVAADRARADRLRGLLGQLRNGDLSFAASLLEQYQDRHTLSVKQWYWIDELAKRAEAQVTAQAAAPKAAPAPAPATLLPLIELFDKAAQRMQFPTLVFSCDGRDLKLTRTGVQAREPGAISVTSARGGFNSRRFYGTVGRDGRLRGNSATAALPALQGVLETIAADPLAYARAYGLETKECCFCATELTDPRSRAAGYGPTCAKNYGLPWG